jgi:hypothetical protein
VTNHPLRSPSHATSDHDAIKPAADDFNPASRSGSESIESVNGQETGSRTSKRTAGSDQSAQTKARLKYRWQQRLQVALRANTRAASTKTLMSSAADESASSRAARVGSSSHISASTLASSMMQPAWVHRRLIRSRPSVSMRRTKPRERPPVHNQLLVATFDWTARATRALVIA